MVNFKHHEKIDPISGSEGSKLRTEGPDYSEGLKKTKFDEAFEKADPTKVHRKEIAATPPPIEIPQPEIARESLMELAKKESQAVPKVAATPSELSAQASHLRLQMDKVSTGLKQLNNQNVQLPATDLQKMSTYIEHVNQGLRAVTSLTKGVEVGATHEIGKSKPPLLRFLSYLTESDKKLNSFVDELGGLKIGEQKLSPEVLLGVQIKLGFISQELEFFTATLNKALESTKTVMNVQI
jgi:hypothetical protein